MTRSQAQATAELNLAVRSIRASKAHLASARERLPASAADSDLLSLAQILLQVERRIEERSAQLAGVGT